MGPTKYGFNNKRSTKRRSRPLKDEADVQNRGRKKSKTHKSKTQINKTKRRAKRDKNQKAKIKQKTVNKEPSKINYQRIWYVVHRDDQLNVYVSNLQIVDGMANQYIINDMKMDD